MADRTVLIDCDAGRALGCESFCCRLIVRLAPGERDPGQPNANKSCVDKDPTTGLCVHHDAGTGRCGIWGQRPAVCRAYECNSDPLLRRVLKEGFRSLTRLVTASEIPPAMDIPRVPEVSIDDDDDGTR